MCVYFIPKEGLYPLPSLRATMAYGIGTLVLKGPKQYSVDPGILMAMFGSIVALKETLMPSER